MESHPYATGLVDPWHISFSYFSLHSLYGVIIDLIFVLEICIIDDISENLIDLFDIYAA